MLNLIIAQIGGEFAGRIILYLIIAYVIFFIHLYIFRAIFNIPSFLKYQKAQVRLLEELAKKQGVEPSKVQGIVSETYGWDGAPQSATSQHAQEG